MQKSLSYSNCTLAAENGASQGENACMRGCSLQTEALGVHDGQTQAITHDFPGAVRRQQQRVEASVCSGQLLRVGAIPLDDTPTADKSLSVEPTHIDPS